MKNIAKVIRARIEEKDLKVKAVAEAAGMTPGKLSALLNERQRILATDFISLCRVLDLSPDDFV